MTLALGSRSHKMLPSTIHIMWPMHLRTLKLLCPMVQEKMELQEKTLFYPRSHEVLPSTHEIMWPMHSCYFQKFMRWCVYKQIHYLTFDLGVKVIRNVTQYPRHHVTYAQANFEVATSEKLWGDAFTTKKHYLTFDLGVKVTQNVTQYPLHHVIYPSTKFEVAMSIGLGEDTIARNVTDGRTDRQTDRRTDGLWFKINIPYFSNEKAGIKRVYNKHIIIKVTWSGVQYHVSWMRPYHWITLDASRLGWSDGMTSSTRCDTVRQINCYYNNVYVQYWFKNSSATGHIEASILCWFSK